MSYKITTKHARKTVRQHHKEYSIIFFDDMKYNIIDMNKAFAPHITCVYLPHKKINLFDTASDTSIDDPDDNSYVQQVSLIDPHLFKNTTKSFELAIHKPILFQWAYRHKYQTKIVIFDWDHALSVTNGVFPPNAFSRHSDVFGAGTFRRTRKISYQSANIHLYDIAVFLMGGKTRLSGLIGMFRRLHREGCKIFILTANSIAIDHKREFVKVIQVIIPNFQENHLICSNLGANSGMTIPKSQALLQNPVFQRLVG